MTHWRHHRARDGMIYIQDARGYWHWVTPAHTRRSMHRLACVIVGTVSTLMLAAALLLGFGCARVHAADRLPFGLTCLQIIEYSRAFPLPNTRAGRDQAKSIARTFGVTITEAQLDEAARCLSYLNDQPQEKRR